MDITKRRPAIVPVSHPEQRYFSETHHDITEDAPRSSFRTSIDVYRASECDTAAVRIEGISHSARIKLTPADLRRLASDLLDAADDIEQNPASALAAAATQPEQVPA